MLLTREAEARSVRENDGLVFFVLRRFADRPDFEDLVQLGRVGLLLAIRKYNPSRGKFSTMAIPWIWSAARRMFVDAGRECRNAKNEGPSLDQPIGPYGDSVLGETIADPHSGDAFEQVEAKVQTEKYLSILNPREVRILRALASGEKYSTIAARERVCEHRIQQIRFGALQKIRRAFGITAGEMKN